MNDPEPLSWAELDQLADWTEGLLTGPDADHITHLITTDRRWTTAHHDLTHAQPTLHTALHTAANAIHPGPLPPDIAHRINHTLTHLDTPARARAAGRTVTGASGPGPTRPPAQRPPGRPPAPRPARRRLLVGLTAVVLFAAIGGGALVRGLLTGAQSSSSPEAVRGGDGAAEQPPAPTRPEATDRAPVPALDTAGGYSAAESVDIYASNTDYEYADLATLAEHWPSQRTSLGEDLAGAGYGSSLASPDGFRACVAAVTAAHPGDVTRALFARYAGGPALFLAISAPGTSLIVVVGPRCGQGTTDELARAEG